MKLLKYTQILLIASILLGGVTEALSQGGPPGGPPGQLVILGAEPNLVNDTMIISGENLGAGPVFAGTVSLFLPTIGEVDLTVTGFDPATQEISVELPEGLKDVPGTYLLTVNRGSPSALATNTMDVNFGVEGDDNDWQLQGNAGTTAGTDFLGTTDDEALELKVNNVRALRLEPNDVSANAIIGKSDNFIAPGVVGSFIAGGGMDADGTQLPNEIHADYGTIGGGKGNIIAAEEAHQSTISGGGINIIGKDAGIGVIYDRPGSRNVIAGGRDNVIFRGSNRNVIGGGRSNTIRENTSRSTIGGGRSNTIRENSSRSTIVGGQNNIIRENTTRSTILGGQGNEIGPDNRGVVIGGLNNSTGDNVGHSIIAGGRNNVIASGASNATIGGGRNNIATGSFAAIPGGANNTAWDTSFAAGNQAKAIHEASFVWGDSTNTDLFSTAKDQFTVRASGGVRFFSNPSLTTGVELPAGSGAWLTLSDRSVKENIVSVNGRELLERLSEIPIQSWNYRSQDDSIRHIGPMSQDFSAAFGFGPDDRHISTVDADGVALAAIQALHEIVEEQELELNSKDKRIEGLEERLTYLEEMIGKLSN